MSVAIAVLSVLLILVTLVDAFEAMVLPRRVGRRYGPTRLFYRFTWKPWSAVARRIRSDRRRGTYLSVYGPLSELILLSLWASALIVGFGLLHWSIGSPLISPDGRRDLRTHLYMSGVTFFTLGFGDVTPREPLGRTLTVMEAGIGFGFLAVVIGYLPVLYQAFSRREVSISLLDGRAGSPPSAAQLLLRMAYAGNMEALDVFLERWEQWSAELLESHLSFPVLSYYRSQHDNQSWLAALTVVLDTCALIVAGSKKSSPYQAQVTFAMARHAAVDLALVFHTPPMAPDPDRLPPDRLLRLGDELREAGLAIEQGLAFETKLAELRSMYEPFVNALARFLLLTLPPVLPEAQTVDNWQTSAWTRRIAASVGKLASEEALDEHFD